MRGFADAIMMRFQLFLAKGGGEGYFPEHYDQIFYRTWCNHDLLRGNGSLLVGMMNISVPLQLVLVTLHSIIELFKFWLFAGAAG